MSCCVSQPKNGGKRKRGHFYFCLERGKMRKRGKRRIDNDDAAFAKHKKFKLPNMLCCVCGDSIPSNPSGMCVSCLRSNVDITKGIPRETVIYSCRGCGRFLAPPWTAAALESPQLMAICLKKIPALRKKVKLIDADFVWTEAHSKRLKIKITIQKEVHNVILEQKLVVTFVVTNQTCDECTKQVSNNTWSAVVQLRQKTNHKRTILFLEQLMLKHGAHRNATGIQSVHGATTGGGLDFFFRERNHARTFISFVEHAVPCRTTQARQLATHDSHSNEYSFKYTFLTEIVPVCRDDLIVMPQKTAKNLGDMGNLAVVTSVSKVVHVIDPVTMKRGEIDKVKFFKAPFRSICTRERLVEFIVIDVELVRGEEARVANANARGKYLLAEVTVARSVDFGNNDTKFVIHSYLGKILRVGDTVLGYDLTSAVFNDSDAAPMKGKTMPSIVLVKKTYPLYRKRNKGKRIWKLKQMDKINGTLREGQEDKDMEMFMQDLEEDKALRSKINLYKNKDALSKSHDDGVDNNDDDDDDDVEDDFPEIELDELLDELDLADGEEESNKVAEEDDDDDI